MSCSTLRTSATAVILAAMASFCANGYAPTFPRASFVSPCATSPLFASSTLRSKIGYRNFRSRSCRVQSSLFQSSSRDDAQDAEIVGKTEGSSSTTMTLLERIDAAGQKLKPMAIGAKEKSVAVQDNRWKSILYSLKSCGLFALFILYRAYRGFFVIIPAVFREVYDKMADAVDAPFVESDYEESDINPETGKVRARTRITVSILAALLTVSYVVSGAFRVLGKFLGTITSTSSVKTSFEAAADEVIVNEGKIMKLTEDDQVNGEELRP